MNMTECFITLRDCMIKYFIRPEKHIKFGLLRVEPKRKDNFYLRALDTRDGL
jgi:hypothetical protein